jgi:hypothetical protein
MPSLVRRTGLFLFLAGVLYFPSIAVGQTQVPATATAEFVTEVEKHFGTWDKDKDGKLSSQEIDELVANPVIKGKAAAAVAALKRADRSSKYAVPPLTRAYFQSMAKLKGAEKQNHPDWGGMYVSSLRRIEKTNRALFVSGMPQLETMHQGRLGDCYFLAPVGAALHRNPASVKGMFRTQSDGTIEVRFANGRKVCVQPITDAELGLTSSTNGDGVWLNTLEKAFGASRNERLPEDKQKNSTTDLIAKGGSSRPVIEMLTGHKARGMSLRPKNKKEHTEAEANALMAQLRPILTKAQQEKRLVCCGTAGTSEAEMRVPGINGKHAYAVLHFDAAKDEVEVWNPHGNTFRPKGDTGLKNGYPTKAGRFTMPLRDFVRAFAGVSYETGEPLQATASRNGPSR